MDFWYPSIHLIPQLLYVFWSGSLLSSNSVMFWMLKCTFLSLPTFALCQASDFKGCHPALPSGAAGVGGGHACGVGKQFGF